jgi:hypothetical protein
MNHWGAWQVQEESITLHIEPLSEMIAHALTIGYLRPALLAEGFDRTEVEELMVWYDTSDLRTRPDRSASALEAYDRYELSGEAMLREMGLGVDDMPTEEVKRTRLIRDIVRQAPTSARDLLPELGIHEEIYPEDEEAPVSAPPEVEAGQGPPERATVLAACDQIMHRAMERAGSRLRSAAGKSHPQGAAGITCADPTLLHCVIDATQHADLSKLLFGAWTTVPMVAERAGVDPRVLESDLDTYARSLLATGQAHTWERLAHALTV